MWVREIRLTGIVPFCVINQCGCKKNRVREQNENEMQEK